MKWRGRYTDVQGKSSPWTAARLSWSGNALTETSSTGAASGGTQARREPPAAEKAASRPGVKTLPSAGRNGRRGQRRARCPAGRPPSPGQQRGRPGSRRRRRKCGGTASSLLARTPKGSRNPARSVMISRVLAADLPRHVGEHVHDRRLAASPPGAEVRNVPHRPRPLGPGPGGRSATRRRPAAGLPEETVIQVEGVVTASPQAPGGAEITEPGGHARCPGRPRRRRSTCTGPPSRPALPAILDGAPTSLRHPVLRAGLRDRRGQRGRVPGGAGRAWASPRCTRRRSSSRRPSPARTCSASTTSAGPPTWPSRRSSTSRPWSACSSGSTRWARCSGPSRTTRPGTWPSTPAWTPSSASSPTTAT